MRTKKINSSFLFLIISTITLLLFFVLNTSTIKAQSTDVIHPASSIVDGDLIKTSTSHDIYIVKISTGENYRRLILNPTIFDSYGHLEWSNVKKVSSATMNSFIKSQLVREVNADGSIVNGRVYMLFDNGDVGTKRHIQLTQSEFLEAGGTDASIYNINHLEASETFYTTGASITTVQEFRSFLPSLIVDIDTTDLINSTVNLPATSPIITTDQVQSTIVDRENGNSGETSSGFITSGSRSSGSGSSNNTNLASIAFTKQTLQPTTILPGSKKEVLTINVLSSNRSTTVRSMKIALSPTTGTDTSIENTFNQIQLIVDGSVVSTKNIESTQGYEKVLNTAVITLNNLAIDIEEDSTKSIQIHLSTTQGAPLKDWNIIINKDSISAIDDDNNTYSNNNPITILTSVSATNIQTVRPPSTVRNFIATSAVSSSPSNISLQSSSSLSSVSLRWNRYEGATSYEIEYCKDIAGRDAPLCLTARVPQLQTEGTILTTSVGSLTDGTVYTFKIRAVLPNDRYSAYKTIIQVTPLNVAPTLSSTSTTVTLNSASFSWTSITSAEGYLIEKCSREEKATECNDYVTAKIISDPTITSATLDDLDPSSIYQMRVKSIANHPKPHSNFSNVVSVRTKFQPPTNLRTTSTGPSTVTLQWDALPMSEGYRVLQQCQAPNHCTQTYTSRDGTASSMLISRLTADKEYSFSIKVLDAVVEDSSYSSGITSRTTLATTNSFQSLLQSRDSMTVDWGAVAGATGYILQACEGVTCTDFVSIYTGALLTYEHTSLQEDTIYKFRLKTTGTLPRIDSPWSRELLQGTHLSRPENFRTTGKTATTASFGWDAVPLAESYEIRYCAGVSCRPDDIVNISNNTTTTKTISSLNSNTIYSFRIRAINSTGSFSSIYSSLTTLRTTVLSPSNFRSTAKDQTSITLGWNSVTNSSGYIIIHCEGDNCTPDPNTTDSSKITRITSNSTTSKQYTSLFADTVYKFIIKSTATNPKIESAYSNVVEVETDAIVEDVIDIPDLGGGLGF